VVLQVRCNSWLNRFLPKVNHAIEQKLLQDLAHKGRLLFGGAWWDVTYGFRTGEGLLVFHRL
jgi:hypothetical protein